jgi:hypothetical protein
MLTTEPPAPPQPAGGERPSTPAPQPATGILATARTVVVTAALVAGGLLLAGYLVHEVTGSHGPIVPTSQVGTSNGPVFPGSGGNDRPRFRGRRPGGFGVQPPGAFSPNDPSSGGNLPPGGPGGGFGPPDGGASQGDTTTPTTGRA